MKYNSNYNIITKFKSNEIIMAKYNSYYITITKK